MSERKNYIFFSLFLLWLGHLVNVYLWLKLDVNYLTYDAHRHFLMSLKIFDAYQNPSRTLLSNFVEATQLHPPLVGILTAPFYFLFGITQDAGVMINAAIFLAILIFYTYKIGEKLIGEQVGLLAAFLVTIYPVIFNQLKIYMLDVPLTAFITMSIYFLLASKDFKNLKYSMLFGISCGLGMLIKQSFCLFIIGPIIYIIIRNIFSFQPSRINNSKQWVINLALSMTLGFIILLPYYFKKINIVLKKTNIRWTTTWLVSVPESNQFLNTLRSLLWYLWGFINWQVSFFFFLTFILGFLFYLRTRIRNKWLLFFWILTSWILVSYFRYTIGFDMEVTGIRYTIPLLPAVALITAIGIMQIAIKKIRIFCITIMIIFGVFQLFFISYPLFNNRSSKRIAIPIHLAEHIKRYKLFPESIIIFNFSSWGISGSDYNSHPRNAQNYLFAIEEIFRIIDNSKSKEKATSIFIIPDDTRLWYLQYKAYIEKKSFQLFCDWNYLQWDILWEREATAIQELVLTSDYIIDKDNGWLGEHFVQHFVTKARAYFNQNKDKFTLLAKVSWPDNSNILIFKRKI